MLPFYLQERNETLIIILIDIGLRVGELVTFNGEYLDSALSRTYDFCRENNLQVDVRRIYDVGDSSQAFTSRHAQAG